MKKSSKLFETVALVAVIGLMTACGGSGGGNAAKNIVGTWEHEMMGLTTTMILNTDKTGSMDGVDIFWEVHSDKDGTYVFIDREPLPDKFEVTMLQRPHYIYDAKEGTLGTGSGMAFKKVK